MFSWLGIGCSYHSDRPKISVVVKHVGTVGCVVGLRLNHLMRAWSFSGTNRK